MAFDVLSIPKRFYKTFSNLRTGIVLLILVVIAAALGTFILQRPATGREQAAGDVFAANSSDARSGWPHRRVSLVVVSHPVHAGQPEHRLRFGRALSQRLALLRASLSQDRFALPLGQSLQNRISHSECRAGTERRRARAEQTALAGTEDHRQGRNLAVSPRSIASRSWRCTSSTPACC